jgi:hypothetical protein
MCRNTVTQDSIIDGKRNLTDIPSPPPTRSVWSHLHKSIRTRFGQERVRIVGWEALLL